MPRLHRSEYDGVDGVYSWEEFFGLDSPDYLPYWVEYMRPEKRLEYLHAVGQTFKDFVPEMMDPRYDWKSWKCKYDGRYEKD